MNTILKHLCFASNITFGFRSFIWTKVMVRDQRSKKLISYPQHMKTKQTNKKHNKELSCYDQLLWNCILPTSKSLLSPARNFDHYTSFLVQLKSLFNYSNFTHTHTHTLHVIVIPLFLKRWMNNYWLWWSKCFIMGHGLPWEVS